MPRILTAFLAVLLPLAYAAAEDAGREDTRPACSSHNQGQLWPEAANHDSKLRSRLIRCAELFICVRGTWHYRWESPSVRLDQLARGAQSKPAESQVCEADPTVHATPRDSETAERSR